MSKAGRGRRKRRSLHPRGPTGARADGGRAATAAPANVPPSTGEARKRLYLDLTTLVVLIGLGTYQSARYYQHVPVPQSDFASFVKVGHDLFAGKVPRSLMRAPVTGLMQAALSKAVAPWHGETDRHPDLTAGWLLNCILHPLNVVLFWLVGRQLIGHGGLGLALVAAMNPIVLISLVHPIAETPLLLFVLLSFLFIFRRSRWAYVFASVATMTRYEGAALIVAAFLVDMLHRKGLRQRLAVVGLSALAALPLAVWMLGTCLMWRTGRVHYLSVMRVPDQLGTAIVSHLRLAWWTAIMPLLTARGGALSGAEAAAVQHVTMISASALFLFAVVWAAARREWKILALMVFLVPYFAVHVLHPWLLPRFCVPYSWLVLLVCAYGAQGIWRLTDRGGRAFRIGRSAFLAALALASLYWVSELWPSISQFAQVSRDSRHMAYVALAAGAVVVTVRLLAGVGRAMGRLASLSLVTAAMIVSSQFPLAVVMGNGDRNREFKDLLDWYSREARTGEVLVTTLADTLTVMAPRFSECLLHPADIPGETPAEFVRGCWDRRVTYVAWDSRIGSRDGNDRKPPDLWYTRWKMRRLQALARPASIGPFGFLRQIRNNASGTYINVFRLQRPPR